MKKSIDEKKQKWEEARAKYVVSSGFRFICLIYKSVTLYLKAEVSAVRLLSIMTFFLEVCSNRLFFGGLLLLTKFQILFGFHQCFH